MTATAADARMCFLALDHGRHVALSGYGPSADRARARSRSYQLHASVRSPWEAAVMCEQRGDRCVTTLTMPNGSVADSCPSELSLAMSRAALLVWSTR